MNIVVLAGGISTEREISIVSGTQVCKALRGRGHRAVLLDVFCGDGRITEENAFPDEYDVDAAAAYARSFDGQLDIAREKEENGAVGFLTQPVLSRRAIDNLQLARESLRGKLLGGVMPIVSQRNALFLQREVSGVYVDEAVIARYEGADRERGEELAVAVSAEFARAVRPMVDGYYLMTPFGRTGLVCRVMDAIRGG